MVSNIISVYDTDFIFLNNFSHLLQPKLKKKIIQCIYNLYIGKLAVSKSIHLNLNIFLNKVF